MGEKAVMEGSSIFESLFGGFSNGLSIFTNNPFRRKNDIASATDDPSLENERQFTSKRLLIEGAPGEVTAGLGKKLKKASSVEKTGTLSEEKKQNSKDDASVHILMQAEENSETHKKVKRVEEDLVSEKKRRKIDSTGDATSKDNVECGSTIGAGDSERQLSRQSTRSSKKRQNDTCVNPEETGNKERKLEKSCSEHDVLSFGENESRLKGKRPQKPDGEENRKKKTKRGEDVHKVASASPLLDKETGGPAGIETRFGSKRKKEDHEVEELYKRKRREIIDEKETSRVPGSEKQGGVGHVTDMELVNRSRGKRKLNSDDEREGNEWKGSKKKTTKEERRDDEERLQRTIFIGNLPVNVKTKHLVREFSHFGAVESARLRSVPLIDTKLPRKAAVIKGQLNDSRSSLNGYVVFDKAESARAALAHNMTEFNGKHLRVDMATAPCKSDKVGESGIEYDRARSIFVGNLPFDVEDEEIYSLFKGSTPDLEVEAVRIVRDPQTSIGKGFAFVSFKKKVGATTALNNAEFTSLRNRQLRILCFGFQKKQGGSKLRARSITGNHRAKPRVGPDESSSKRGVLSYEGRRSNKSGSRPGKVTGGLTQTSNKGKPGERGGSLKRRMPAKKKAVPTKRPAVAARKLAARGEAHTMGTGRGKKNREGKGKKVNSKGEKQRKSK